MSLTEKQQGLINKFVSESLTADEAIAFRAAYESNELFAQAAFEHAHIGASNDAILNKIAKKGTVNHSKTKRINVWQIAVAASVLLLVALGIKLNSVQNLPPMVLVETDTLFLPKNEYFSLPNSIAPSLYAQNIDMDKLVEQTNIAMRSSADEICLPKNEMVFKMGAKVDINLLQFKPGSYRLSILGFYQQISLIDTVCNKTISISKQNKLAFSFTPLIEGTYYWMLYFNNQKDPYLVRKFIVEAAPILRL